MNEVDGIIVTSVCYLEVTSAKLIIITMKILAFLLLFGLSLPGNDPVADLSSEVIEAIKKADAAKIAQFFNEKVSVKIIEQEDVYSRSQAESVLKDFFQTHPVKSFDGRPSNSQKTGNQFVVGNLVTTNGTYRLSFLIKKYNEKFLIAQFRIENEND
jgi:hypothetical protein